MTRGQIEAARALGMPRPLIWRHIVLPQVFVLILPPHRGVHRPRQGLLDAHGIRLDHIDYELEGTTATEAQASLLNVMTGFPLLVIRYTPIGLDGLPMLKGRTTSRADRFTYEFCARPATRRGRLGRGAHAPERVAQDADGAHAEPKRAAPRREHSQRQALRAHDGGVTCLRATALSKST